MTSFEEERLARARRSLEGLSVGDALGGFFEGMSIPHHWIKERRLPNPPWHYTDDTAMALSIVASLRQHAGIEQDWLARSFAERYQRSRGYGPATRAMLSRIRIGRSWREEAASIFGGQGSFGNGAAMRVAPVGAYFADDLEAAIEHARRSAEVTHMHAEAIAGAIAVAVASAWAWRWNQQGRLPDQTAILGQILEHVPEGAVRSKIELAQALPPGTPVGAAAEQLGNGRLVSAQDTVPFALWCASNQPASYEEALWLTLAGGGDSDTTCAMVGGVVVMATGEGAIPAPWRAAREPLPAWPFQQAER